MHGWMKKVFFSLLFPLLVTGSLLGQDVVINELMSDNESTIQDMDGDYKDWIELYNNSSSTINLENFSLSDDMDNLEKWVFPAVSISPNGFLLIFASGKDVVDTSELHTNFKIKQSGEAIYLSNADSDIISSVDAIHIPSDQAYACIPNGSNNYSIVNLPTPNASNENSSGIYCSHPSGFYDQEFMLNLTGSNENIEIRYTMNGGTPTINSPLYSEPLEISNISSSQYNFSSIPTTPLDGPFQFWDYIWKVPQSVYKSNVLRFASFEGGEMQSKIYTRTYFVDPNIEDHYTFPILSLVTDSINLFDYDSGIYVPGKYFDENGFNWWATGNYHHRGRDWEREVHISFFEPEGTLGFETDAGMRMRGYGSAASPQKSFGIYLRDDYGLNKIDYPIFEEYNADAYKRLVFRNSGNDFIQTHFRDALLQDLIFHLDLDLQNFRPSVVFLNGEYWGLHGIRQKYDKHYFKYHFDIEEDNINILGICGDIEEGDNSAYDELIEDIEELDMSLESSYQFVKDHIDIQNFMDFQIAEIYYANYDWPCNNFKIWKTNAPGSKWRFLIYDLDMSFAAEDLSSYETSSLEHATTVGNEWPYCSCSSFLLRKLLENEGFKNEFINRFSHHLQTTFNTEVVLDRIDEFVQSFLPEMDEHIARWNYPSDINQWYQYIETMREFAKKRPCFMGDEIIRFFDLDNFDFECLANTYNEASILMAPNPSGGELFLFNNLSQDYFGEIRIYSIDGQLVYEKDDFALEIGVRKYIDVSRLRNGTYLFNYYGNGFSEKRKLLIVKQ